MKRLGPWPSGTGNPRPSLRFGLLLASLVLLALTACFRAGPESPRQPPQTPPAPPPVATTTPQGQAPTPHLASPQPAATAPRIPTPPDRDLWALARRFKGVAASPTFTWLTPSSPQAGRQEEFWVTDLPARQLYQVTAALRLVSPTALWYVDTKARVSDEALQVAARAYEEQLLPRLMQVFGEAPTPPGTRLTILHTPLRGAMAYFGSTDQYPQAVQPYSNQRPMLYVTTASLSVGGRTYLGVLAHELQHAIHWWTDPTEETWINEGLSELATEIAGYPSVNPSRADGVSLTLWPDDSPQIGRNYSAALRFFRYLTQHYGGWAGLPLLLREPADGPQGVEAYLQRLGFQTSFREVFGAWTVANVLGTRGPGVYGYDTAMPTVTPDRILKEPDTVEGQVQPFAARYIRLEPKQGTVTVHFQGQVAVPLLPTQPPSGASCWWSNRGDAIHSRLTRELDLRGVQRATLQFQAWHDIEKTWDYAYVTLSEDGGQTWRVLSGQHTLSDNPLGNALGPGYTGRSPGWIHERIDLSPYAGRRLLLSFEYVTDDAVHGDGLCLDDIAVPEIGFHDDAETTEAGWSAEGFVRTDNILPQEYLVYVVELPRGGGARVRPLLLQPDNTGELRTEGFGVELEAAVVVVASVTAHTSQPASYTVSVTG